MFKLKVQDHYSKVKKFLVLVLTFALCALSARAVAAGDVSLSVSPPVTELLLRPNIPVKHTVFLKTNGANLTVVPELHLAIPTDNLGHIAIEPNPLNLTDLPLVITSDPPLNIPVKTSGDLSLTLTLTAANTDVPLDSYLALVFRTTPVDGGSATSTTPAISALLLTSINPTGTFPVSLELSNFDLPLLHDSTHPLDLSPTLHNSTSSMIRPHGTLTITSPRGISLTTIDLFPHLILSQVFRQYDLSWTPRFSNIGPHRLKLTITTEGGAIILESEKIIWFFPWRISLLILLVMALAGLTLARVRSRLKVV